MAKDPFQQLRVIKKASQKGKPIKDCFRLLYKKDLWVKAFASLSTHEKGHSVSIKDFHPVIDELIQRLRNGSYRFKNLNTSRQSPSFEDLLVLETVRIILEPLSEPSFLKGRGLKNTPHRALLNIRERFGRLTWCIKGEITPIVFNHKVLIKLISGKISDRRFLHLIKNALTSGVLDNKNSLHLCLLLKEISLLALDEMIIEGLEEFYGEQEMKCCLSQKRDVKRTEYIRSDLEFVIGICDSKNNARTVLEKLQCFFEKQLRVDSDQIRLFLSHLEKPIPFLGYEFLKFGRNKESLHKGSNRSYYHAMEKRNYKYLSIDEIIRLQIPVQKIREFVRRKGYGRMETYEIHHRPNLMNKTEREILALYNSELRRIAGYYKLAENFHHLEKLFYLAEGSFIKTIACKRSSTYAKTARSLRAYKQGTLALAEKDARGVTEIFPFIKFSNLLKKNKKLLKRQRVSGRIRPKKNSIK